MTFLRVQSKDAVGNGTINITLGSTPTNGNVLIMTIGIRGNNSPYTPSSVISISQTGVTWSKVVESTIYKANAGWALKDEIWKGMVGASPSTSITVTVTTGAWASCDVCEYSYSGILGVDKTNYSVGGLTASPTTGTTATTTYGNELWVGGIEGYRYTGASFTFDSPTNGFTEVLETAVAGYLRAVYLEKIVTSKGAAGCSESTGATTIDYAGTIATFYEIITTTKTDSIDILIQKLGITKTDSIDTIFAKLDTIKTDNIDIMFNKSDITKTESIDIIFKKLGITLIDFIDFIIVKLNIEKTYSIDSMFKYLNIIKSYNVDINILKLNIIEGYPIDVIIKSLEAIKSGGGGRVEKFIVDLRYDGINVKSSLNYYNDNYLLNIQSSLFYNSSLNINLINLLSIPKVINIDANSPLTFININRVMDIKSPMAVPYNIEILIKNNLRSLDTIEKIKQLRKLLGVIENL